MVPTNRNVQKMAGLEYLKMNNNSKKAIILLHGYGANMHDLYGIGEAVPYAREYDWFFPNAPLDLAAMFPFMESRAWFPIDMEALQKAQMQGGFRDFDGPASTEFYKAVEIAEDFFNEVYSKYDEVVLGGFSQGAMVSTHVALRNSEKVKALLCMSGAFIDAHKIESYEPTHKFPVLISHGYEDPVLDVNSSVKLKDYFAGNEHETMDIYFHGEHTIPMQVLERSSLFLAQIP